MSSVVVRLLNGKSIAALFATVRYWFLFFFPVLFSTFTDRSSKWTLIDPLWRTDNPCSGHSRFAPPPLPGAEATVLLAVPFGRMSIIWVVPTNGQVNGAAIKY